jgi:hypothetical protein
VKGELQERIARALAAWYSSDDDDRHWERHTGAAGIALVALGLDDLDAFATAVGRAAWVRQHELGHRLPPLAIDDIVRTGLEAALTPPETVAKTERDDR